MLYTAALTPGDARGRSSWRRPARGYLAARSRSGSIFSGRRPCVRAGPRSVAGGAVSLPRLGPLSAGPAGSAWCSTGEPWARLENRADCSWLLALMHRAASSSGSILFILSRAHLTDQPERDVIERQTRAQDAQLHGASSGGCAAFTVDRGRLLLDPAAHPKLVLILRARRASRSIKAALVALYFMHLKFERKSARHHLRLDADPRRDPGVGRDRRSTGPAESQ